MKGTLKRSLALLLAIAMCLSLASFTVLADEDAQTEAIAEVVSTSDESGNTAETTDGDGASEETEPAASEDTTPVEVPETVAEETPVAEKTENTVETAEAEETE